MLRKITDLIKISDHVSCSYEVTPNVSTEVLDNLDFEPLFLSITWHAQTHECKNLDDIAPLRLANYMIRKGKSILLHMACTNTKKVFIDELLPALQEKGICNLFIILGDNFDPNRSDFTNSRELILYIRQRTGNYFCIGVAGFPDTEDDLLHLKEKIDSGVDFILTQAFFDYQVYSKYLSKCKKVGINVPIIPGVFPFETRNELEGFISLCKIHITPDLLTLSNKKSANEIVENLVTELHTKVEVKHFHFFTLNKIHRTEKLINKMCLYSFRNKLK